MLSSYSESELVPYPSGEYMQARLNRDDFVAVIRDRDHKAAWRPSDPRLEIGPSRVKVLIRKQGNPGDSVEVKC